MAPKDWNSGFGKAIAVFLNGQGIHGRSMRGERVTDRNFLVLFNASDQAVEFTLPPDEYSEVWEIVVDSAGANADTAPREAGATISVEGRSLMVLRAHVVVEIEEDHSVAASLTTAITLPSVTDAPSNEA